MTVRQLAGRFTLNRPNAVLVGESLGEGRDVLLLHAGGENRMVWRPVMQILAKQGLRTHAYDQRGHGESGGSVAEGIDAFGEDAAAMIERLDRPIVVGGSLGGFALMLALETCEPAVSSLVLVDVIPNPDPERTWTYLSARGNVGSTPLIENILSQTNRLSDIVSQFSLPILFVGGGNNSPIDSEARANFVKLVPHIKIEEIASASHLVARDAPAELARLIANFAHFVNFHTNSKERF